MKRLIAGVVVGASLWAVVSLAEAHKQVAPETCGLKRATVEYSSRHVRVVRRWDRDYGVTKWFACSRLRGQFDAHIHRYRNRRKLASFPCDDFAGCTYPDEVEILDTQNPQRRLVAASVIYPCGCDGYCQSDQCLAKVAVLSVRTGKRAEVTFYVRGSDAYREFNPQLTPGGTAVWIEPPPVQYGHDITDQVTGLTLDGDRPVFDEGPEDALTDLAVTGQTLYWKNAGELKSAQVP